MSKTTLMLLDYIPYNDQEQKDVAFFIECEKANQILTRDNEQCHLTASSFVINKTHDKVLAIFHNIYKSWTWVGGHADGEDDMLSVALRETREETSLQNVHVLLNSPISVDSLPVAGHVKRGKYVPAHIHLNITYLLEADENEAIHIKPDENSDIKWLTFEELLARNTEPCMQLVFAKIIAKIKILEQEHKI